MSEPDRTDRDAETAPRFRTLTDDEIASIRNESRAWRSAIGERFAAIERRS